MTDRRRINEVRVKICGLTRVEDVQCAVAAGADAIGLVFYAPSPRAVSVEKAQALLAVVSPFVQVTGLFVNATMLEIQQILGRVPLDILQFHGDETPAQCAAIARATGRRWIKALAVKPDSPMPEIIEHYVAAGASGILLDAWHPQLKGGTGQTFDWNSWPQALGQTVPLILAGGLNPDNVAAAISRTRPYAVDVSGGVERQKGIKDHQLIRQFIQGVQCG